MTHTLFAAARQTTCIYTLRVKEGGGRMERDADRQRKNLSLSLSVAGRLVHRFARTSGHFHRWTFRDTHLKLNLNLALIRKRDAKVHSERVQYRRLPDQLEMGQAEGKMSRP